MTPRRRYGLYLCAALCICASPAFALPEGGQDRDSTASSSTVLLRFRASLNEPGMFSSASLRLPDYVHGDSLGPLHKERFWWVVGSMAASNAAIMVYYFTTYYSPNEGNRSKWHTFNDWYNSDLNVDKLGHVWGAQMYANTIYHIFRWARMAESDAMLWSSVQAFVMQLEMEMTDAYFKEWGFSWWDVGANAVGSLWPNLQRAYPALQSVNLKMSYFPSKAYRDDWVDYPLKDYDGFTYWLTLSVEDVLPKSIKPYWPDWLGIGVGYGASGVYKGKNSYNNLPDGTPLGEEEWYIALDYDLRKLPGDAPLLRFLKESFNFFHLPSPAIRIKPSGIYYGLFF